MKVIEKGCFMVKENEKIVMSAEEMDKAIRVIAGEIIRVNAGAKNVVFVGILEGGLPIAKRLSKLIEEKQKVKIPVGGIDASLYRDDLSVRGKDITLKKSSISFSIDKKTVVLVDDVLFHGRTTRAALDNLIDYGRPSKVQLAVLIDRGNRELPIQPDFCGKKISTTISENVKVRLKEIDGVDEVIVR
jgi:pyrimidine operon attenuation protein/uracil phosphoribosyltransferase